MFQPADPATNEFDLLEKPGAQVQEVADRTAADIRWLKAASATP